MLCRGTGGVWIVRGIVCGPLCQRRRIAVLKNDLFYCALKHAASRMNGANVVNNVH